MERKYKNIMEFLLFTVNIILFRLMLPGFLLTINTTIRKEGELRPIVDET